MGNRSAAGASVFLIGPLMCMFLITLLSASILFGQTAQTPEALLREAESLHRAGKLDQAIEDYRLFLVRRPEVFQARSDLGAALAGAGRYEEAIIEYRRALKLEPLPQIRLNLALAYHKAGKPAIAVKELEKVRAEMPNDLRAAMLLADCYLRLGENKKVIKLLDPLEPTQRDNLAITYMLGTALVRDGQVARGQVVIDKILRNGDSAAARMMLGEARLRVHDTPGAMDELSEALKLDPKIPLAHSLYGQALLESGHRSEAMEAFQAELGIDPNEFDPNLYLGTLLNEGQQYGQALPYFARALQVRPGAPEVSYQIAIAQIGLGKLEQAQETLEALVKVSPSFVEAHVSLAKVYYRLHRKQDGDGERRIVEKLNAEAQTRKPAQGEKADPPEQRRRQSESHRRHHQQP